MLALWARAAAFQTLGVIENVASLASDEKYSEIWQAILGIFQAGGYDATVPQSWLRAT